MSDQGFPDGVSESGETPDERRPADRAETCDDEVAGQGYATPRRCAEALASVVEDRAAALIDIGCGTGLSGVAFAATGFSCIDGSDLTEEMLEKARALGVYRRVWQADPAAGTPFAPGSYTHAAAVGLFSPDHAPATLIDAVLAALPAGGCFVFSLDDHALEDPVFEGRVREQVDTGAARVLVRDHGDHVPGIGVKPLVYVLQKA